MPAVAKASAGFALLCLREEKDNAETQRTLRAAEKIGKFKGDAW